MTPFARTTATIGGLLLFLFLAAAWGWSQVTKPLPVFNEAVAACLETPISKGEEIAPEQVTVNVLNAGKRQGLAGKTMASFSQHGFHSGSSGNAPKNAAVKVAEIWTDDPDSPAVALVKSRLPKAKVVQTALPQVGVTVVVGDGFQKLAKGKAVVTAAKDTTICTPNPALETA